MDPAHLNCVSRLSKAVQIKLLTEIIPNLRGAQRKCLTDIAEERGLISATEAWCRSRFWWRRLQGVRWLTLLGGGAATVPTLLSDRHPLVRAQAAEWASDHPSTELANRLLPLFSDSAAVCRFAAKDSLLRMGNVATEPLARYLSQHSGHQVELTLEVCIDLANPGFLSPALELCHDEDPGIRVRAVQLLGALGGKRAVEITEELLTDPVPEVNAAAATAIGRLGDWSAAPRLASMLGDPTWEVRRAAGLALGSLGGPGILFLQRSLADHDLLIAGMAQQALDLHSSIRAGAA